MDEIKLYKPYSKQIPIHQACNDDTTFFITAGGRVIVEGWIYFDVVTFIFLA